MANTDEKLVEDFIGGDEKALEELVDHYLKPIYNFVYQLTRDQSASEDITQDVFVKVWQSISSFDKSKKFSTWIYAIAKNTSLDWLKKKKSFSFSVFEKDDGASFLEYIEDEKSLSSQEILAAIDARNDAADLLRRLSLPLQTILLLHLKHGFSFVEIGTIVGQPTNTVKSKYRRAILELRALAHKDGGKKTLIAPNGVLAS